MDSLAQELINEIINHIPLEVMPVSSLVARRWRYRSQQCHFEFVLFEFDDLDFWESNISQHSDSIPSYVRHVRLRDTARRLEPVILSRVLKPFTSIISLTIENSTLLLDDEVAVPVSLGEFGKGITHLALHCMVKSFAGITSLVFSLPNLKELAIDDVDFWTDKPPSIIPDTSQRGPLELFMAQGTQTENYFALSRWKLVSRRLSLDPSVEGVELLSGISSETMVALTLMGIHDSCELSGSKSILMHLQRSRQFRVNQRERTASYHPFAISSFP